jgi:hypothetical protein
LDCAAAAEILPESNTLRSSDHFCVSIWTSALTFSQSGLYNLSLYEKYTIWLNSCQGTRLVFLIIIDYTLTSIQQEIEPLLPAKGSMDGVYLLKIERENGWKRPLR